MPGTMSWRRGSSSGRADGALSPSPAPEAEEKAEPGDDERAGRIFVGASRRRILLFHSPRSRLPRRWRKETKHAPDEDVEQSREDRHPHADCREPERPLFGPGFKEGNGGRILIIGEQGVHAP